jgi:hypothetical protein
LEKLANSIKLPKSFLQEEDIEILQTKFGLLRESSDNFVFTKEQFNGLLSLVEANQFLNLSEAADKGFAIRAAAKILLWAGAAKTIADKAAILSCIIGIFEIDQELATRLLTSVK